MKRLSSHTLRTLSMPLGMVVGALLCRQIVALDSWSGGWITPVLIFIMLFFTYCRVDISKMRVTMMHFWLFAAQIVGAIALYTLCQPLGESVAQGAMICALAPIAMAAVVIGGMLGANIENMTTYSLLCNIVTGRLHLRFCFWPGAAGRMVVVSLWTDKCRSDVLPAFQVKSQKIKHPTLLPDSFKYTIFLNASLLFKASNSKSFLNSDTQIAADLA